MEGEEEYEGGQRVVEQWENTFREGPTKPFKNYQVREIIEQVVNSKCSRETIYHGEKSKELMNAIILEVKEKTKELGFDRHKLIVQGTCGEIKGQGLRVATRCLWDSTNDNYASYSFKNSGFWICVMVFGLYLH